MGPPNRFEHLEIGLVPGGAKPPAGASSSGDARLAVVRAEGEVIVRLDGRLYTSRDTDLPDFAREVIAKVRAGGVTPELVEELKRTVPEVSCRVLGAAGPAESDAAFWREAWRALAVPSPVGISWRWYLIGLAASAAAVILGYWLIWRYIGKAMQEAGVGP